MAYDSIRPRGGDTGKLRNLQKRLDLIQKFIDIKGKKFIDCGCGSGHYVNELLSFGADVYGIEYNFEKVSQFKKYHPGIENRVQTGNIEEMKFKDGTFDVALLNEVLEHISNEFNALLEIKRVLKPNGILIIFSPNRLYPFETHSVKFKNSNRTLPIYTPGIPYIPLWLGKMFFQYNARNYWSKELKKLVQSSGFTIIKVDYIWQTFENISGVQPKIFTILKNLLRQISNFFENVPIINRFAVSQVIFAKKKTINL